MDTRKLKHFLALCEHGTFHKAAEVVHLSQSAISRSIQALEEELGVVLFDRSGHRAQLTSIGRSIAARARQLVFQEKEMQRELQLLQGGESGEISIGASPTPASVFLQQSLSAFAQNHPRVKINVELGRTPDLIGRLRDEKLDLVIVDATDIVNPLGLDLEALSSLPGGFLCRKGHPLLEKKSITLDDLLAFPIACSAISDTLAKRLVSLLGPHGLPEQLLTYRCDSYEILKSVARTSDTLLLSVHEILRHEIDSGDMVVLNIFPEELRGSYCAARLSGRATWPVLENLMVEVRKSFGV